MDINTQQQQGFPNSVKGWGNGDFAGGFFNQVWESSF